VPQIQLERLDLLEREAGADERSRRIVDRRYGDQRAIPKRAAAEGRGEVVARGHVDDHGGNDLTAHGRRDRHRELGIAAQKVRRPIERVDDEGSRPRSSANRERAPRQE